MAVSYTIPQILTLQSTDEYVFDPDPYTRYNLKLYLYAETLDNTVTFYDSQGNAQEPIRVTSGLQIVVKNANYRKVTFADPSSYTVYMVIQGAVYSSDTDLSCLPPSVDLSVSPLSINVNISAQTISQLSVNVAAWSAGTLSIDITAQSVGNIAIDLAAITTSANLNVNLAAQSANLNVALAASSVTLDINLSSITAGVTLDVSVQNASLTVVVSGTADVNISSTTGNIPVSIAASSATVTVSVSGTADVNISSQSGNLAVNLAASAITLEVNVSNASLTVSVSNSNLDVTIQNSILDVQGSVAITIGTTTYQSIPISIVAQQVGNITVDIAAQTVGNLNVNLAAQSVGNLAVNIAAQSVGNLNVNLAGQTGNINVALSASSVTLTVTGTSLLTQLQGYTGTAWKNVAVDASGNMSVNITAQSVGNIGVSIAAWSAGTISVNLAANNAGDITVNLASISATTNLNVALAASSATVTVAVSGTPNINIESQSSNLNVAIAASSATVTVSVSGTAQVNIASTSGDIPVSIAASSATVTVSVSGTADVNISSTTGNIPVTIQASSVSLNVDIGNVPSVNPNFETTLTAALTNGTAYTSLSVNATPTSLLSGQSLTLVSGTDTQVVTVSQTVPAGSTSIPVSSFDANYAYPVGASVIGSLNATIINSVLEVDIKSQSVGDLAVNIAAQSVGNLNVNLAASAVTLDVNISSQSSNLNVNLAAISATSDLNVAIASSSVTLDVNISSQTANINVALAASSITLTTQGNVPITIGTDTYQSIPVSIVAQQIGNIDVNLAAQTVGNIAVDIAANSAGNLTVSLAAIATTANLNINLAASAITLDVNITNASITITGSVSISGVPAVTIDAGTATIGSINEIVSPVIARSTVAAGYQEAVEYLNHGPGGFFASGSAGDSSSDALLGQSAWGIAGALQNNPNGNALITGSIAGSYSFAQTVVGLQFLLLLANNSAGNAACSATVQFRGAIYSAAGDLMAQSGLQSASLAAQLGSAESLSYSAAVFFDLPVALSASTTYIFVVTSHAVALSPAAEAGVAASNFTSTCYTGPAISVDGFPSSFTPASTTTGMSISTLQGSAVTVSDPVTCSFTVGNPTTYDGTLVVKFGLSTHSLNVVALTSLTYSVLDVTQNVYLANGRTVTGDSPSMGISSLVDTFDVSNFTANSGDEIEIEVTSATFYAGPVDGSAGYSNAYFDSLDGVSYLVFPLK